MKYTYISIYRSTICSYSVVTLHITICIERLPLNFNMSVWAGTGTKICTYIEIVIPETYPIY